MTSLDLSQAIDSLAHAVLACTDLDEVTVKLHLRAAAGKTGVFLDVDAPGPGVPSFWAAQEHILVAAKALCTVRAPPALRPDHGADAYQRAASALQAAHECVCGRRVA